MKHLMTTLMAMIVGNQAGANLSSDLPVATPKGYRALKSLEVGDQVLVRGEFGTLVESRISFTMKDSVGTKQMLYVEHDLGYLLASPDQPLLLASGRVVKAMHLSPDDRLVTADGSPVAIRSIASGPYFGSIAQVMMANEPDQGSWIVAGGALIGSYKKQMALEKGELK